MILLNFFKTEEYLCMGLMKQQSARFRFLDNWAGRHLCEVTLYITDNLQGLLQRARQAQIGERSPILHGLHGRKLASCQIRRGVGRVGVDDQVKVGDGFIILPAHLADEPQLIKGIGAFGAGGILRHV